MIRVPLLLVVRKRLPLRLETNGCKAAATSPMSAPHGIPARSYEEWIREEVLAKIAFSSNMDLQICFSVSICQILFAKIGVDTAEREPPKASLKFGVGDPNQELHL